MHRFKFLGDTALLEMFTDDLKKVKIKQAVLVPIPLSIERLADRRFNQAEAIARQMRGKIVPYLSRVDGPAQSKASRQARLARSNPFCVSGDVKGKNIVLIDDVYTTYVTLRQAMIRLKEAGAKEISAVTLFRSI
ncbi:phosphoribosyltransferase family protein [Exiguobacterium sp. SL14]|nr:phosphoribosyltransferase family protein [Exiguobacterium sp. SL14]MCY1690114.1 phosphoribosyltransferase family protein [Exiguobacterium sp. SL14]